MRPSAPAVAVRQQGVRSLCRKSTSGPKGSGKPQHGLRRGLLQRPVTKALVGRGSPRLPSERARKKQNNGWLKRRWG